MPATTIGASLTRLPPGPDSIELNCEDHLHFMTLALEEAKKATPSPTAFCVGCVLVVSPQSDNPVVLSTGYSRELPGNTHAEANALDKAKLLTSKDLKNLYPVLGDFDVHSLLARTDVYTTLEPCSIRTSGLSPCADALIEAKVRRCIIGVSEPPDFVECEGAERLKEAGIDVIWLAGLEDECLKVARREH